MTERLLLDQLRRLRQRDRVVRLLQYGCVAAVVAAGTLPVVYLWSRSTAALVVVTLVGAAAAMLTAWARTLSVRGVAAAADRALLLDDRAVTALQHIGDDDLFSRLVVTDAERRLAAADVSRVFPWSVPRHFGRTAVAAATLALVGSALVPALQREPANRRQETSAQTDSAAAPAPTANADTAASREEAESRGNASRSEVRVMTPDERRAHPPATASGESAGATKAPSMPPVATPTASQPPASSQTGTGEVKQPRETVNAKTSTGTLNARGSGAGSSGSRPLAGGVTADAALDASQRGSSSGSPSNQSGIRTAADRAEAAMARDDVPPAMRAYVRAYFESIRR